VVSRRHLDFEPACALEEVRLAVRIALGELGLAELFTAEEPLRLAPVGDPWDERFSLDRLTEELQTLDLPEAGRVVIDGFEAPSR
jgi:hypothetical protein